MDAEGWYHDPYGIHDHRWMSAGRPTALVRDGGSESHDEPPAQQMPLPLIMVVADDGTEGDDLLRADDATSGDQSFTQADGVQAALGAGAQGLGFNPLRRT